MTAKNKAANHMDIPNRSGAIPLYHQVHLVLLEKIQRGEIGEGGKMPTETELCEMFKVSRITVRRALSELERDNRIRRVQGVGAFVNKEVPAPPIPQTMEDFFQLSDGLRAISNARLISMSYVVPPLIVRTAMDLKEGGKALLSIRVRSYKGTPFFYLRIFTPEALGRKFTKADLAKESLVWLLRSHVEFDSIEQTFSATLADPDAANFLKVPIGSALLQITWIVRSKQSEVIEHVTCTVRPDMYQIRNYLKLES